MEKKKLVKRKKQADKPMMIFEELNRPVTYILDDVKESKHPTKCILWRAATLATFA